jgi:hypothetical protein
MLAPFFVNLLSWCTLLLFVGWTVDLVSGWLDSARHGDPTSARSGAGRKPLLPPRQLVKPRHLPVCAVCEMDGDWLIAPGVTKGRKNA